MEVPAAVAATATLVPSCKPSIFVGRSTVLAFRSNFQIFNKLRTSVSIPKQGHRCLSVRSRRGFVVRAASLSPEESSGPSSKFAPLQLESPVGQFLSEILMSHPHLVPAAVEQQLEQFQIDRDGDKQKEEPSASGTDLVLYRRIAEVKANERRKAIEEILYALVVQKFMDAHVSLIPSITRHPSGRVDSWPGEDGKLEGLHSSEAYEMIQNHLSLILGNRIGDSSSVAQISKLRVGQVYAASVMYGYFLKRVDQRFQLEKTMKILPNASEENSIQKPVADNTRPSGGEVPSHVMSHPEVSALPGDGFGYGAKVSRLRSYVMSFDGETLHRYATIRSKEAVNIIEKHTEALFGRPEIVITPEGAIDSLKDENIKISFGGLKRLVLEAVTFGSFLWDVESYVDSRTILTENPGLPCFCFGHSTGAAITLKALLDPKVEAYIAGAAFTSPAVGVESSHPILLVLAPIVSFLLPRYQCSSAYKKGLPISRDPQALIAKYSDPLVCTRSLRVRTGYEILRITSYLQKNLKKLKVPFFVLHGTADSVTDPDASQKLYEEASSSDRSIKLYEGFSHDLLFEPERDAITQDIIQWLNSRI